MRPRLAVLFHRLGPYHHARLRAAAQGGDLVAIELSRVDRTYQWSAIHNAEDFRRVTLFEDRDIAEVPLAAVRERLHRALVEASPSAVAIPGWGDARSLLALCWAVSRRIPAIVMSETTEADMARGALREAVKRRIMRMFAAALVGGRMHAHYVERLGVPVDRIALGYDCVDNDYFSAGAAAARRQPAPSAVPCDFFLASSRFVPRKNLSGLLRAYARYRRSAAERAWHLVILGDGPLRPALEDEVRALGIAGHVTFPGFIQYGDLPRWYGHAKAFVHSAEVEPWGLVVNEAMACGLPVLVSRQSGCAHELVSEGENGFTFDAGDAGQLALLMERIAATPDLATLGARSAQIVARFSPQRFGEALWSLAASLERDAPRARPGLIDSALLRLVIAR